MQHTKGISKAAFKTGNVNGFIYVVYKTKLISRMLEKFNEILIVISSTFINSVLLCF